MLETDLYYGIGAGGGNVERYSGNDGLELKSTVNTHDIIGIEDGNNFTHDLQSQKMLKMLCTTEPRNIKMEDLMRLLSLLRDLRNGKVYIPNDVEEWETASELGVDASNHHEVEDEDFDPCKLSLPVRGVYTVLPDRHEFSAISSDNVH